MKESNVENMEEIKKLEGMQIKILYYEVNAEYDFTKCKNKRNWLSMDGLMWMKSRQKSYKNNVYENSKEKKKNERS